MFEAFYFFNFKLFNESCTIEFENFQGLPLRAVLTCPLGIRVELSSIRGGGLGVTFACITNDEDKAKKYR